MQVNNMNDEANKLISFEDLCAEYENYLTPEDFDNFCSDYVAPSMTRKTPKELKVVSDNMYFKIIQAVLK